MPALVPRPPEVAFPPGHFTLGHHTSVHLGTGTEPAADLLRYLLALATGLTLRRYVELLEPWWIRAPSTPTSPSRRTTYPCLRATAERPLGTPHRP
ncbi:MULTISPECIES: hypothetical protein [unclassified Streptomyces]|uniref:hypothetical protein n=1 Tax=unclassified Streptomyces TaxID=2593676 RepID=UPI0036ECD8C1